MNKEKTQGPWQPPAVNSEESTDLLSILYRIFILIGLGIKINGSFGIKFDTIIRHIKYLRSLSIENKIIVFSQWPHVLDILGMNFFFILSHGISE